MRTRILLALAVGSTSLLIAGCAQGITEPLSSAELGEVVKSVEKPEAFKKLSLETYDEFVEAYGDQERIDPTFENTSDECSAVADLERVTRFAQGGNDYRKFLPASLRQFNDIMGFVWSVKTSDDADTYSYATVDVAILTFDDEAEALAYSSKISENVEGCFDFRYEENDILRSFELSRFSLSEENAPDFSYEYTDYLEASGFFDIELYTDRAHSVMHFGPNLAIATVSSDEDSQSELGVSTPDLVEGFDELRSLIELAMEEVQANGPTNASGR